MREIKFKGKAVCDYEQFGVKKNTWVYGYYYKDVEETNDKQSFKYVSYIKMLYGDHYIDIEVIPETIGQYTGLKDKNGVEIYEDDIIKVEAEEYEYPKGYIGVEYNAKVYFKKGAFYLGDRPLEDFLDCNIDIEVIGDIYENPELLKEYNTKNKLNEDTYAIVKEGE